LFHPKKAVPLPAPGPVKVITVPVLLPGVAPSTETVVVTFDAKSPPAVTEKPSVQNVMSAIQLPGSAKREITACAVEKWGTKATATKIAIKVMCLAIRGMNPSPSMVGTDEFVYSINVY
jgi:hypothetical protein